MCIHMYICISIHIGIEIHAHFLILACMLVRYVDTYVGTCNIHTCIHSYVCMCMFILLLICVSLTFTLDYVHYCLSYFSLLLHILFLHSNLCLRLYMYIYTHMYIHPSIHALKIVHYHVCLQIYIYIYICILELRMQCSLFPFNLDQGFLLD